MLVHWYFFDVQHTSKQAPLGIVDIHDKFLNWDCDNSIDLVNFANFVIPDKLVSFVNFWQVESAGRWRVTTSTSSGAETIAARYGVLAGEKRFSSRGIFRSNFPFSAEQIICTSGTRT